MRPLLSVVIAAYNVEKYVRGTLRSIDLQSSNLDDVELIIINDGSKDDTLSIVQAWARAKSNVTVIDQENQGVSATRQIGLDSASGIWITSVDPDDILDRDYFLHILSYIRSSNNPDVQMIVTNVISLNDATGRLNDNHPLRHRFIEGSRVISLSDEPQSIQLGATAVMRMDVIRHHRLRYDVRIRPTFEDAHFIGRYLAFAENPEIAVIAEAKYYYRKRSDRSSLVQSSWNNVDKYYSVLRYGYLGLLAEVKRTRGAVPQWAQFMVLYDLCWYFVEDTKQFARTAWISDGLKETFLFLLKEIFSYIEISTIETFQIFKIEPSLKKSLLVHFKDIDLVWSGVNLNLDPSEELSIHTHPELPPYLTMPKANNTIVHKYFGIPFSREYIYSADRHNDLRDFYSEYTGYRYCTDEVMEKISPRPRVKAITSSYESTSGLSQPRIVRKILHATYLMRVRQLATGKKLTTLYFSAFRSSVRRIRTSFRGRREAQRRMDLFERAQLKDNMDYYSHAWCILDRPGKADDNGEHLYRFLRDERSDINAFFILRRDSLDWERLSAEGFRLLEPDSDELSIAVLNSDYIISSDAVYECMYPVHRSLVMKSRAKFIFLQHGVLMNDLSRWLNPKDISLMITSTPEEYKATAGEDSPYRLAPEQIAITGLARFDQLLKLRGLRDYDQQNVILVMPTWRHNLKQLLLNCEDEISRRQLFRSSKYYKSWESFLSHPDLKTVALSNEIRVVFFTHPALQPFLDYLDLPEFVEVVSNDQASVQTYFSQARILVTDYSSVSFDAAYIRVPSIYYQFDRHEIFGGSHNFRAGYFNYIEHGFGPVVEKSTDAIKALISEISEPSIVNDFGDRFNAAFPSPDNNNRARIVETIEALRTD
ncbi:bifunctional glycosyltransferase/CDP-glycerol:glycerophosphate glycerophosphotransferase [Glutamicibacter halophytocola]|uniref:CDP-glycerol glycerophosphotransferase family protein n=1 Tax=Glutamicibacter halophytocola TaxID=1933880 RepID=A0AA95BRI8_9MICC|nr:CDP-glycerol glycerophosphotransferase family protein [Glutamicibacter halophytocola]UUX60386.1 CDP-glycerol glycerophosphotransferase family protein [Glutamicibacter halophytocola]